MFLDRTLHLVATEEVALILAFRGFGLIHAGSGVGILLKHLTRMLFRFLRDVGVVDGCL